MSEPNNLDDLARLATQRTGEEFKTHNGNIYPPVFDFSDLAENVAQSFGSAGTFRGQAWAAPASDNPERHFVLVKTNRLTTDELEAAKAALQSAREEETRRNGLLQTLKNEFGDFQRKGNIVTLSDGVSDPKQLEAVRTQLIRAGATDVKIEKGEDNKHHLVFDISKTTDLSVSELQSIAGKYKQSLSAGEGQVERLMLQLSENLDTLKFREFQGRGDQSYNQQLVSRDPDGEIYLQVPFDSKANAEALRDKLQAAVGPDYQTITVASYKEGQSYYLRFDDIVTQMDSNKAGRNIEAAAASLLELQQKEKDERAARDTRIGSFLTALGGDEKLVPNDVGQKFRLEKGFSTKAEAEQAAQALNASISGLAEVSAQSVGGRYTLLLDASKITEGNAKQLDLAKTVVPFGALRGRQNGIDAAEALSNSLTAASEANTRNGNVVTLTSVFETEANAQTIAQAYNNAQGNDGFATVTGSEQKWQITFDASKVKDISVLRDASPTLIATRTRDNGSRSAREETQRTEALAALKEHIGGEGVNHTTRSDGGVEIKFDDLPKEVEERIFKALGFSPPDDVGDDKTIRLTGAELAKITPEKAQDAGAVYKQYKDDVALEETRFDREARLESSLMLAAATATRDATDKSRTLIFFSSQQERDAVAKVLNTASDGSPSSVATAYQITGLTVNLDDLDVNKLDAAKQAQSDARTAVQAAETRAAEEAKAEADRRAQEEKDKKTAKDQTNMWINIGGPILGAIVGLFMGGGFSIGGIISAIAVGAAAWIGTQAFTETGLFAKPEAQTPNTPAAPATSTAPSQGQEQEQTLIPGEQSPGQTPKKVPDPNAPATGAVRE